MLIGDILDKFYFDNVILVVLYGKSICESMTLNSLSKYRLKNSKLVIHNNGPESVVFDGELYEKLNDSFDFNVEAVNDLNNTPLSKIYNQLFIVYSAERFIILDDDTQLSDSFVFSIENACADLDVPRIISSSNGISYYPISDGVVIADNTELNANNVLSIGSGLIINTSLIDKFNNYNLNVFDENYALYGVDYSLFRRIWWLVKQGESVDVRSSSFLIHSLSRVNKNERKNKTRNKERVLDVAITARRYPTLYTCYIFLRKLVGEFLKMNASNVVDMIKAYVHGCHPRCYKR